MTACHAFYPEIHTDPQHQPAVSAAWVRLFHNDHVVQPYIHEKHPFLNLPAGLDL